MDVSPLVLQNHQTHTTSSSYRDVMDENSPLLVQFCCLWRRHWLRTSCKGRKEESNITVCCSEESMMGDARRLSFNKNVGLHRKHLEISIKTSSLFSSIKPFSVWLSWEAFMVMSGEENNGTVAPLLSPQNRGRWMGPVLNNEKPFAGSFTFCRAGRGSSLRSAATTKTIWRNFSAGRRLDP